MVIILRCRFISMNIYYYVHSCTFTKDKTIFLLMIIIMICIHLTIKR